MLLVLQRSCPLRRARLIRTYLIHRAVFSGLLLLANMTRRISGESAFKHIAAVYRERAVRDIPMLPNCCAGEETTQRGEVS
jgi:hypothetical protein